MWELKPVIITLWRNRLGAVLVIIQIALTLAVISNAWFVIAQRQALIDRDTGMPEDEIFSFTMQPTDRNADITSMVRNDLQLLRTVPGIIAASPINNVPLAGSAWQTGLSIRPDSEDAARTHIVTADENIVETLGVKLSEGRNFLPEEVTIQRQGVNPDQKPSVAIVTRYLADSLFPDGSALGKSVYNEDNPIKIIGIVEHCFGSALGWEHVEAVAFHPLTNLSSKVKYIVRTRAQDRARIMREVEQTLVETNSERVLDDFTTLNEHKAKSYLRDAAMVKILTTVSVILVVITLLGIIGLTVFWVNRRRKQIGTRRALGATRMAITRYFLVENFILSGCGLMLGSFLAFAFNSVLVRYQEQQPLDTQYLTISAIILLLMGLCAAFWPALRAADIPPALATRSV